MLKIRFLEGVSFGILMCVIALLTGVNTEGLAIMGAIVAIFLIGTELKHGND